jgi:hypothetical protein
MQRFISPPCKIHPATLIDTRANGSGVLSVGARRGSWAVLGALRAQDGRASERVTVSMTAKMAQRSALAPRRTMARSSQAML